jgi:hypothetical protein
MVVDVCTRGECVWIDDAGPDAESTLYRSTDGGVSWEELGVLNGKHYPVAITEEGLVVRAWGPETKWKYEYELFPSGEPLEPPPGAGEERPQTLPAGELAWPTDDGRLLRGDGSQILSVGQGATFWNTVGNIVPDASGERLALAWRESVGVFSLDGRPIRAFSSQSPLGVASWLSDTLVAGNVPIQWQFPTGTRATVIVPAIIDLEAGEARPIPHPFLDQPLGYSYTVRAAMRGPFARVINTGACLDVRQQPTTNAAILACAADGVLLRDTGETHEADGATWRRVVTPAGVDGWASAQYLER